MNAIGAAQRITQAHDDCANVGWPAKVSDQRRIAVALTRPDLGIMIPVLRTQPGLAGSVSTPVGLYPSARTPCRADNNRGCCERHFAKHRGDAYDIAAPSVSDHRRNSHAGGGSRREYQDRI